MPTKVVSARTLWCALCELVPARPCGLFGHWICVTLWFRALCSPAVLSSSCLWGVGVVERWGDAIVGAWLNDSCRCMMMLFFYISVHLHSFMSS